MAGDAAALLERNGHGRHQQRQAPSDGQAWVADAVRLGPGLVARRLGVLGAELSQHIDLRLIAAMHGPVQSALAVVVSYVGIGAFFQKQLQGRGARLLGRRRID